MTSKGILGTPSKRPSESLLLQKADVVLYDTVVQLSYVDVASIMIADPLQWSSAEIYCSSLISSLSRNRFRKARVTSRMAAERSILTNGAGASMLPVAGYVQWMKSGSLVLTLGSFTNPFSQSPSAVPLQFRRKGSGGEFEAKLAALRGASTVKNAPTFERQVQKRRAKDH